MQWFKNHPGIWHIFQELVADDPSGKQLVRAKCGNMALIDHPESSYNVDEVICPRCSRLLNEPPE